MNCTNIREVESRTLHYNEDGKIFYWGKCDGKRKVSVSLSRERGLTWLQVETVPLGKGSTHFGFCLTFGYKQDITYPKIF